jgi:CRISPR-associated endonuclease/helicase Cas3
MEALAVAGHHRFLSERYLFDRSHFLNPIQWEPDPTTAIEAAVGLAKEMFRAWGWKLRRYSRQPSLVGKMVGQDNPEEPFDCLLFLKGQVSGEAVSDSLRAESYRELFTLLKGLLMTADWMASGAQDCNELADTSLGVVRVGQSEIGTYLRERIERRRKERPDLKIPLFKGYTEVQSACAAAQDHVLAIAPTGSGKTEAALLWALGQVERGNARKVFFLLPTMVTANSIHDRLSAFFRTKGHRVGLVHSTADMVKSSRAFGEDEADRADVRAQDLSESHFFSPVTVGTVDQLLVPLFHAGRWAMKTFAAADSAVVIDEIHAYEPHTVGLIVLMMRQLRALGARFMVMSATMPANLRRTILEALEPDSTANDPAPVTVVEDRELLDSARNIWCVNEVPLTQWLLKQDGRGKTEASDDFLDLWNQVNERGEPLNILVVVNTVKRCQDLAHRLREFEPVCYHSKFIFRDRCKIEEGINAKPPRLLIATQVVEVSLELDYDVLLTECAPIDALVQRAGRVNRARRLVPGRIMVHPSEDGSQHVYGQPPGILEISWELCHQNQGCLSESDLIRLVEEAYSGRELSKIEEFRRIQIATTALQLRLAGVLDAPNPEENEVLRTRLSEYQQLSVIPDRFHVEVLKLAPRGRRWFELKVPAWYARDYKTRENNPEDLPICRMKYGARYGARLITPEGRAVTGTTIA